MRFSPSKFKAARKAKKLTLAQLAELMDVSRAAIGHWETGNYLPPPEKIENAARFLEVKSSDLFGDESEDFVDNLGPIDQEFAKLIALARGITPKEAVSQALRECVAMSMQGQKSKQPPETDGVDQQQGQEDGNQSH